MKKMKMKLRDREVIIQLYDNESSNFIYENLPQNLSMNRWGDEYYGMMDSNIPHRKGKKQEEFQEGEVALWPQGNAFCIFFGPTPVSVGNVPKMASPGVALGKVLEEDLSFLKKEGDILEIEISR